MFSYAFLYIFYKISYNSLRIFSHSLCNANIQCSDSYQGQQNIQVKYLEVDIHNAVAINTADP